MRIVNFLLAGMFLIFAFLQVNDPDPLIWILIYGSMSVYCIMAMFQYYPQRFLLVTLAVFILYSLLYVGGLMEWIGRDKKMDLFDDLAKMEHPYIEETREFMGLMICVGVLVIYVIQSRKIRKQT